MRLARSAYLTAFYLSGVFLLLAQQPTLVIKGKTEAPAYPAEAPFKRFPTWSGGMLVALDHNDTSVPVVHAFDQTGLDHPIVFSIPDAQSIHIENAVAGANGAFGIVGFAYDQPGHGAGFVACVSPDGLTKNVIRTSAYLPQLIAVAPDGTLWTKGWQVQDPNNPAGPLDPDVGVIRHFDVAGHVIGSFLPRAFLLMGSHILVHQEGSLFATSDRVGWQQSSGGSYYEIKGGDVVEYPRVAPHQGQQVSGMVLTDNGTALVSTWVNGKSDIATGYHLYYLDRSNGGTWKELQPPAGLDPPISNGILFGASGNTVAFRSKTPGVVWLVEVH